MRALLIGVGVAVAVVLGVVILWTTSVDRLLAGAIERYASEALGAAVRVGSVTLSTAEGKGTIAGLRVAQPEGFGTGDAITVDEIVLDLDTGSLVDGDPYVVEVIRVAMPRVHFVMKPDRSNNLSALQENIERNTGRDDSPPEDPDRPPTRVRIAHLDVEGGRIEADLSALGIGTANAPLPPIEQRDVGGPRGAPPEEIAASIGRRFLGHALNAVTASTIGRRLDQLLDKNAAGVRSMLDSLFKP